MTKQSKKSRLKPKGNITEQDRLQWHLRRCAKGRLGMTAKASAAAKPTGRLHGHKPSHGGRLGGSQHAATANSHGAASPVLSLEDQAIQALQVRLDELTTITEGLTRRVSRLEQVHQTNGTSQAMSGEPLFTIAQFCSRNHLSRSTFYTLHRAGSGPQRTQVRRKVFISAAAEEEWRRSMQVPKSTSTSPDGGKP